MLRQDHSTIGTLAKLPASSIELGHSADILINGLKVIVDHCDKLLLIRQQRISPHTIDIVAITFSLSLLRLLYLSQLLFRFFIKITRNQNLLLR